ncbi:MAG: BlaI/MecI/CopY family transcriptional regulator [Planctomycetaceae bacterium]
MKKQKSNASRDARLPDAETDVLACLCREGPLTAAEIRKRLEPRRPMAHGSVVTLLKRLQEKKLVKRARSGQGKSFLYQAARPAESSLQQLVARMADRVFGGSGVAMLASLLDVRPPSAEELAEMRRLLEQHDAKGE